MIYRNLDLDESKAEYEVADNAIKLYVRSGRWRDQTYLHEPGGGPHHGRLERFANSMEQIARSDANFAATYGTRFHRPVVAEDDERVRGWWVTPEGLARIAEIESGRKRKRDPTVSGDESPSSGGGHAKSIPAIKKRES